MPTAMPTLVVEVAWASQPTTPVASRTWTDISAYVQTVQIRRGRSDELDRVNASTATLRVRNTDGRFDPTNASGAYAPNVLLGKPIRIRAQWTYTDRKVSASPTVHTYDLFHGYIWSYPPEWPANREESVTLGAIDEMGSMGRAGYYENGGRPAELAGSRIADVVTSYWGGSTPSTAQIDTGVASVLAIAAGDAGGTVTNPINALQHAQDAALTEGGLFYIRPDGLPRFEARSVRQNALAGSAACIFGDNPALPFLHDFTVNTQAYAASGSVPLHGTAAIAAAGIPTSGTALWGGREITYSGLSNGTVTVSGTASSYSGNIGAASVFMFGELPYKFGGLSPDYDDTYLVNEWNVTSAAGSANAIDVASVQKYFRRTQSRETIGASATELNATAAYLLGRYKDPALRFPTITVDPQQLNGADWPTIFGLAISDRVIVKRRPPGSRTWRQDCLVEGVSHDIDAATWRVAFNLSPADMTQYWILGTHAQDTTAKVGY